MSKKLFIKNSKLIGSHYSNAKRRRRGECSLHQLSECTPTSCYYSLPKCTYRIPDTKIRIHIKKVTLNSKNKLKNQIQITLFA